MAILDSSVVSKLRNKFKNRTRKKMEVFCAGWSNTLHAGEDDGASGFEFFVVGVDLTEDGLGMFFFVEIFFFPFFHIPWSSLSWISQNTPTKSSP